MLSPNPTNFVSLIRGGAVTVTANEQLAVRLRVSVAVHVTVVAPTLNVDVLVGKHDTVTGGAPDEPIALPYTTVIGTPSGDAAVTGCGHVMMTGGGSVGGTTGAAGLPPHRAASTAPAVTANPPRRNRPVRIKLRFPTLSEARVWRLEAGVSR